MSIGSHAFLIIAHEDEKMLLRLSKRLASLGPIFIHVDAKTDISSWDVKSFEATFISPRIPVYWGDWSVVEATLLLLEAALATTSINRFTLLSGSHYPIISNEELQRRSETSACIIAARPAPNMPDGSRPESEYYRRFYRAKRPEGIWSRLKNGFMNRVVYFCRPLDWKSVTPPSGMRAGQQFWSIERDFAEYCVSELRSSSKLIDYFRKIICSDEKIFATLYGAFSGEVGRDGTTFCIWSGGSHPRKPTCKDLFDVPMQENFWFARKFGSNDFNLLDELDSASA